MNAQGRHTFYVRFLPPYAEKLIDIMADLQVQNVATKAIKMTGGEYELFVREMGPCLRYSERGHQPANPRFNGAPIVYVDEFGRLLP